MKNQSVIRLFNPLKEDFSYEWFDNKDHKHTITLPSLAITKLPWYLGQFMKKHLIDAIDIQRGSTQAEDVRRSKIEAEIVK